MAELSIECPTVASGTILTLEDHETIDSLVHNLAETSFTEIIRNQQNQVTDVNVRVSDGGTLIRSTAITRINNQVTEVVENQHDAVGTIIQTLTTTLNRVANKVVSVEVVET